MKIKVIKIATKDGGFYFWIDGDQGFNSSELLEILKPLDIVDCLRVHQSFGPAEYTDDIHTKAGIFRLREEFDEFAGATLHSENKALMNKILAFMLKSGRYNIQQEQSLNPL
ncbi:hypothetical protein C0J08_19575 [Marinomonas sp. CT5]|uniref:hypothetical protein n=1 Tax=Marinomonas sp. CT5 TaxID=2066133 RepID=UPI001BAEA516|nr:hypothetical protein [Marinomonas sp. CT5]QUX97461.1 hypothetical protein C0J08_19575 [Marinomonas sp. CT5]